MLLKTLTLKNFKKHEHLRLTFETGANLITGPNYAGKSTILRAIFIALFGNSIDATKSAKLVRRGAKDFTIELEIGNLVITRTLKESSIQRIGEEPYARGHTAVNKAVTDELGLDKDAFMKVFASEQGTPQALLSMEGAQLQRFIESLIGIGEMDDIAKRGRKKLSDLRARCEALYESMLSPEELAEVNDRFQEASALVIRSQTEIESKQGVESTIREQLAQARKDLSESRIYNDQFKKWKIVSEQLESELPRLDLKDLSELSDKLDQELDTLKALQEKQRFYHKQLGAIESLQRRLDKLESQRDVLRDRANKPSIALRDASSNTEQLDAVMSRAKGYTIEIKGIEALLENSCCPTCKREYELDFDLSEIQAKYVDLKEKLAVEQEATKELVRQRDEIKAFNSSATLANDQIDRAMREFSTLLSEIDSIKGEVDSYTVIKIDHLELDRQETFVDELTNAYRETKSSNELAQAHNARIDKLSEQVSDLYNPLFSQGQSDTGLLEAKTNALQEDLLALIRDSAELMATSAAATETMKLHMHRLDSHHKVSSDFDRYSLSANRMDRVLDIISNSRSTLIGSAYETVFNVAATFARSCTDGDIQDIKMTPDGIVYVEDGQEFDKTEASGAQRSIIGLGMKLGMAQLLPGMFDSLLLDEVSADMSDEISMRCMLALSAYCGQSIVVTHRQDDVGGNVIRL